MELARRDFTNAVRLAGETKSPPRIIGRRSYRGDGSPGWIGLPEHHPG
jgi:hypothetical protein